MPLLCLLLLACWEKDTYCWGSRVWIENCRTQTAGRRILYYSGSQSVSNCITSVHFYLPVNTLTVNFKSKLQQVNGQHIYLNFMVPDASAGSILPPKTASTCIKLNVLGATSVLFQLCEVQAEDEKYGDENGDEDDELEEDTRPQRMLMRMRMTSRMRMWGWWSWWRCEDDEDQEDESNP